MKRKLSVTIGIPAYNEAGHIKNLLTALLKQKEKHFTLLQIIVVSDGSQDETAVIARAVSSKKIVVIDLQNRIGQQCAQNIISQHAKGEIVVFIEADTLPVNSSVIDNLVKSFVLQNSHKIGMTIGVAVPYKPRSVFENILYHGSILKEKLFYQINGGDNVYACSGHNMKALRSAHAKRIHYPPDVPEDAFTFFRFRQMKLRIQVCPNAIVKFRNVMNFQDRMKQVQKFKSGKKSLEDYFPARTLREEYSISKKHILKTVLSYAIREPFWLCAYLVELMINRMVTRQVTKFNHLYTPYLSSKI